MNDLYWSGSPLKVGISFSGRRDCCSCSIMISVMSCCFPTTPTRVWSFTFRMEWVLCPPSICLKPVCRRDGCAMCMLVGSGCCWCGGGSVRAVFQRGFGGGRWYSVGVDAGYTRYCFLLVLGRDVMLPSLSTWIRASAVARSLSSSSISLLALSNMAPTTSFNCACRILCASRICGRD